MTEHWIWLSRLQSVGPFKTAALLRTFSSAEEVYFADSREYYSVPGIKAAEIESLCRKDLSDAERILEACANKNIRILTLADEKYPSFLKSIDSPPAVLYYYGQVPDLENIPVIGIVGTRKASAYGMSAAKRLGYQIEKGGAAVVSGMAKGIDAAAMEGALNAGNLVIGVLGCGVDVIYPKCNKSLYDEIRFRGWLVSEYPPGTEPDRQHFPVRNRIISGLSDGVLVVEAAERSGSLITARHALEQGRDVFAVPGVIDSAVSAGSNRLLKDGAGLVDCGWDVLGEYDFRYPGVLQRVSDNPPPVSRPSQADSSAAEQSQADDSEKKNTRSVEELTALANDTERIILQAIGSKKLFTDDIVDLTRLPASKVLSALTVMEIKGLVCRLTGNRFRVNL